MYTWVRNNDNKLPQGLEQYSAQELRDIVAEFVSRQLIEFDDLEIVCLAMHGSRLRGDSTANSDLDIIVEYVGPWKECDVFNALHDEPLYVDGIEVDLNPITARESGDMNAYLAKSRRYDKTKIGR